MNTLNEVDKYKLPFMLNLFLNLGGTLLYKSIPLTLVRPDFFLKIICIDFLLTTNLGSVSIKRDLCLVPGDVGLHFCKIKINLTIKLYMMLI